MIQHIEQELVQANYDEKTILLQKKKTIEIEYDNYTRKLHEVHKYAHVRDGLMKERKIQKFSEDLKAQDKLII